jgi:hypothetical protein
LKFSTRADSSRARHAHCLRRRPNLERSKPPVFEAEIVLNGLFLRVIARKAHQRIKYALRIEDLRGSWLHGYLSLANVWGLHRDWAGFDPLGEKSLSGDVCDRILHAGRFKAFAISDTVAFSATKASSPATKDLRTTYRATSGRKYCSCWSLLTIGSISATPRWTQPQSPPIAQASSRSRCKLTFAARVGACGIIPCRARIACFTLP